MDYMKSATGAKSLLWAAREGRWDDASALLQDLGGASWSQKLIMGQSPEEAAFKRALEHGGPDGSWIEALGWDAARQERLVEIAAAESSDSARAAAAGWMGWMSPSRPEIKSIDALAAAAQEGHWPGAEWAIAIGSKARRGLLSREWAARASFWSLASRAGDAEPELFSSLAAAGLMAPISAANGGAIGMVKRWVASIPPSQALALLVAASCSGMEDWEMFEQSSPRGFDGASWRDLALAGAGMPLGSSFEALDFDSRQGPLACHHWSDEARERREIALEECASRSAEILASPLLAGALGWITRRVSVRAAAKAMPGMAARFNIDAGSDGELIEKIDCLAEINSDRLPEIAALAAGRLWRSLPGGVSGALAPSEELSHVACALWSAKDSRGFESFISEISRIDPRAGAAAVLSGFPKKLLSGADLPPSSGHVIALLRSIPTSQKLASGRSAWEDDDFVNLKICISSAARMALGPNPENPPAAPSRMPVLAMWGGLDLSEPKWTAEASSVQAWDGWEGAFEAAAMAISEATEDQSLRQPTKPWSHGGGEAQLDRHEHAPSRNAWSFYCGENPHKAAEVFAAMWMGKPSSRSAASAHVKSLSQDARAALSTQSPLAFERVVQSVRDFKAATRLDLACQAAASALAPESFEPYCAQDAACAAIMCSASHGLALRILDLFNRSEHVSLADSAMAMSAFLPSAAHIALTVKFDGGEGCRADDLAGRAVVADLVFKSIGWGDPATLLSMEPWNSVPLNPASAWTKSCLRGLFMAQPSSAIHQIHWEKLFVSAMAWAKARGLGGLERPCGIDSKIKNSALEMAVNSAVINGEGSFGDLAVKALIEAGSDPSDLAAPDGYDALALCAKLERRSSPSSLMKILLSSPKAQPGNGALWSVLASGKGNLSEKMGDGLHKAALAAPTLESLARLAMGQDSRIQKSWISQALAAPAAQPLLPELMGEMLRLKAPVAAAIKMKDDLSQAGIQPSSSGTEAAFSALLGEIARGSTWGIRKTLRDWSPLMLPLRRFSPVLLNGKEFGDVSESWALSGGEGDATLCEALCSVARRDLAASHKTRISMAAMAIESAMILIDGPMVDPSARRELSKLMSDLESRKMIPALIDAVGEKPFSAIEGHWLAEVSFAVPSSKSKAARL